MIIVQDFHINSINIPRKFGAKRANKSENIYCRISKIKVLRKSSIYLKYIIYYSKSHLTNLTKKNLLNPGL